MIAKALSPSITCPDCGHSITLTEAVAQQIAGPVLARKVSELRREVGEEVRAEHAAVLQDLSAKVAEKDEALKEHETALEKLRADGAQLRRDRRKLEDEKKDLEGQQERMRDEIRKQERKEAQRTADQRVTDVLRRKDEDHLTEKRQLEDQIRRMNDQIEELRRKGEAGSRQEAGMARQDLFGEELQQRFRDDEIIITPRGQAGADVTQRVRTAGRECGVILWECKRTARWDGRWPGKLARDAGKARANLGVIVSETLPHDMDGSGEVEDGLWVCDYRHATHLAAGLRQVLIDVWRYESANAARAGIAGKVYDYITTGGFAARYKDAERAFDRRMKELDRDRRAFEQSWKRQERDIREMFDSIAGVVADLIGVGAEVPPAAVAEFPDGDLALLKPGQATLPELTAVAADGRA